MGPEWATPHNKSQMLFSLLPPSLPSPLSSSAAELQLLLSQWLLNSGLWHAESQQEIRETKLINRTSNSIDTTLRASFMFFFKSPRPISLRQSGNSFCHWLWANAGKGGKKKEWVQMLFYQMQMEVTDLRYKNLKLQTAASTLIAGASDLAEIKI